MAPLIEWGAAGRALEVVSGDRHVVVPFDGGTLVVLMDGLGHGPPAADASLAAVPVIEEHAHEPVQRLIAECHDALRRTRGVVMTVATFHAADSTLTWGGVGNVGAVLVRAAPTAAQPDRGLSVRPGVVGYQLPPIYVETLPVAAGDTLILTSDGIKSGFVTGLDLEPPPAEIAESILARFDTMTDDAHVLVARYVGEPR